MIFAKVQFFKVVSHDGICDLLVWFEYEAVFFFFLFLDFIFWTLCLNVAKPIVITQTT